MVKNDTLENARPELHGLIVEDLKGTGLSYRAIGLRRRCGEHVVWAVAEANGLWRRWSAMDEAVDRALNPPPKLVIASLIDARFPEIAKMATPGRPQGGPAVAAVRQRFWRAVDALVGDGSIQERLVRAAQHLMTLASEGLPEGLRGEFDAIWNRLTREKATEGEDAIQATARKMSSEDASELARRILSIYAMLRVGSASRNGSPGRKPSA